MVTIEIDKGSGFCFGVVNAIRKAEEELDNHDILYCLGDIVHNTSEVNRLEQKGMVTINYEKLTTLKNSKVLFRAHGEPPGVYKLANESGLAVVDATCPVVLKLQKNIRTSYQQHKGTDWQIVIFGKKGHAEVNGLVGQTEGYAIVVENLEEAKMLDFTKPIELFSQTTMALSTFTQLVTLIKHNMAPMVPFHYHDTICRQVAMRLPNIYSFARKHDYVFFIAGKKSSNGKALFAECLRANPQSKFISEVGELSCEMLPFDRESNVSVGICGATSTPRSQMEQLASRIRLMLKQNE